MGVASSMLERGASAERSTSALKGELGRVSLQPPEISPENARLMVNHLERGAWTKSYYEHINAKAAFQKIVTGQIPTDGELQLLRRAFPGTAGKELVESILSHRTAGQKAFEELVGIMGLPQTFSTAFDFSVGFRQMATLGAAHPSHWGAALRTIRDAAVSPEAASAIERSTRDNPWVAGTHVTRADGVVEDLSGYGFTEVGGHLSDAGTLIDSTEREGQYASLNRSWVSRQVQRIPGIQASERAYVVPLNKLRADVYASEAQAMWDTGMRDIEQYKAMASTINHASGWGDFAPGQVTKGLNAFFSPRNVVARFQVVLDPFTKPGSLLKPSARQLAAKNLVGFAAYNVAILGLIKASGLADVELDPRSTDFAKARVGNMRIDFMAGYAPMVRLVARLAPDALGGGVSTTATGKLAPINRKQLLMNFVRGKLGPIPAAVVDEFAGSNAIGQPVDLTSPKGLEDRLYQSFTPFVLQDVVEALKEQGKGAAIVAAPATFLGLGVNSYSNPSRDLLEARDSAAKAQGYKDFADASAQLGPNAAASKFGVDQGVQKAQGALDALSSPLKDATAATLKDQQANDDRLSSGAITASQWRDQNKIINASRARGIIDALDGRGSNPTGDSVLDGYYAVFRANTNAQSGVVTDPSALQDALDSYQATLSPEQQQRLDANIGISRAATPQLQQYRQDVKEIAATGYFDIGDRVYARMQAKGIFPADAASFSDYLGMVNQRIRERLESRGMNPDLAPAIGSRLQPVAEYNDLVSKVRSAVRQSNPQLLQLLVKWGYKAPALADAKGLNEAVASSSQP